MEFNIYLQDFHKERDYCSGEVGMETMVQHPPHDEQDELVREFCREAEGLITMVRSRIDAERIKQQWCQRFQAECKSSLVINAAATYLDQIISHWWESQDNGRLSHCKVTL
jgi:hypothetical protein